jgi:hypothetical protein
MPHFGRVEPPTWEGKRVILVGGGPSLRGFDFNRFYQPGNIVVGINQSMFDLPRCDAGVSMDYRFVERNHDRLAAFARRAELFLAIGDRYFESQAQVANAIYLRNGDIAEGLSFDPAIVHRGGTSGFTALNVAALKRPPCVILCGYDYGTAGTDRHHYHDAYRDFHDANAQSWRLWAQHYRAAAACCRRAGITVINASLESGIDVFPRCALDLAFPKGERHDAPMADIGPGVGLALR